MASISEFLESRIAEDDTRAVLAAEHFPGTSDWWDFTEGILTTVGSNQRIGQAFRHIDRHSPAQVLAECAAKRAIIDLYERNRENRDARRSPLAREAEDERAAQDRRTQEARTRVAEDALRSLAAVYSDHEDYRQEWARG